MDHAVVEVDILRFQAGSLALSEAESERDYEQRAKAVVSRRGQKALCLVGAPRHLFCRTSVAPASSKPMCDTPGMDRSTPDLV